MTLRITVITLLLLCLPTAVLAQPYPDGRPAADLRMPAVDQGVVLKHGDGPDQCDLHGARDLWLYEDGGTYYMNYDGAGPTGWLACLATSKDLLHWDKKGPVLSLGKKGDDDSASASYGVTYKDGDHWHMFYLGTPHVSGPGKIPSFPYLTMKASGPAAGGPWTKQPDVIPFRPRAGTYYDCVASPGQIVKDGDDYLMFFSGQSANPTRRTIGIARTRDLNGSWTIDKDPIVPQAEQIENTSIYYEPSISTWFMFTDHIGVGNKGAEYTDAIWVYWSKSLTHWKAADKAVVLDGQNCKWSKACIGLPGVIKQGNRLAVLYDAAGNKSTSHMNRDIGLAYLELPLKVPVGAEVSKAE